MKHTALTKEAVRYGWDKTKKHWWFFATALAVLLIISGALPALWEAMLGRQEFVKGVMNIASTILQMIISLGLTRAALNIFDKDKPDVNNFLPSLELLLKYILASLLYGLAVAIGTILLIVPGIILGVRLHFFGLLMVDKKMDAVAALKESYRLTEGHFWDLAILGLATGVLNMFGAMFFMVGLLVTVPISLMASCYAYRKLAKPSNG